jgi:hypothetical protein
LASTNVVLPVTFEVTTNSYAPDTTEFVDVLLPPLQATVKANSIANKTVRILICSLPKCVGG